MRLLYNAAPFRSIHFSYSISYRYDSLPSSSICFLSVHSRISISAGFAATEWISALPDAVFDFILDPDNARKVMPSVTENVKITDGPVHLGTRFRETRQINGKAATAEIEVTTFEPPHRYGATSAQNGITTTYLYTLHPERSGTRINLNATVSASGLKKLMVPVVVMFMKKQDGDHLLSLKRAVETRA